METYVREHHTQLRRRLESVKRIHKASDTVDSRLAELKSMQTMLHTQRAQYNTYRHKLDQLLTMDETDNNDEPEKQSADILTWDHTKNF